jgi:hypothetical protein
MGLAWLHLADALASWCLRGCRRSIKIEDNKKERYKRRTHLGN